MRWVLKVAEDQWVTWVQHTGIGALAMATDLRLGTDPWIALAVVSIMLIREALDLRRHRLKGTPDREYTLDFGLDWLTVLLGVLWGAWIGGGF